MDSRLAHFIEAKQSILVRWRKQRLNRRLRKKVAQLNKAIQEHCKALAAQQWEGIFSGLGLGARSNAYTRDFLTRHTAKLCVNELDLEERELGSVGTPQGSVISR
ncbi:hypothetical protein IscW_ISCW013479 [Ixodes scapularis]|uniref:Uncharacterized protein n=1 Tax=Ixodes scapularis TaxID=6945 RepID=B7QA19_IXOSC|nr:hypothetical protein IscW_ISCW013479 [Ixodes scapularis]|eukprot:XP_002399728.1 hypothetical protein IscW_ISCW013479 [Ixodes scapularis]